MTIDPDFIISRDIMYYLFAANEHCKKMILDNLISTDIPNNEYRILYENYLYFLSDEKYKSKNIIEFSVFLANLEEDSYQLYKLYSEIFDVKGNICAAKRCCKDAIEKLISRKFEKQRQEYALTIMRLQDYFKKE